MKKNGFNNFTRVWRKNEQLCGGFAHGYHFTGVVRRVQRPLMNALQR
jgi:hypothetical protein